MDRYIKESDFLNALWWDEDNQVWEITDERLAKLQSDAVEVDVDKTSL